MANEEVYSPVSIPKESNGGRTKVKDPRILIGRVRDVVTFPVPDKKGIIISQPIVMVEGKSMVAIEVTASSISISQPTEGDPDNKGSIPAIEVFRPGSLEPEFEAFVENNLNEDLFVIVQYPEQNVKKLFGSRYNPLQMTVETTDNNEGDVNKITLTQARRGRRACFYQAALPPVQGEAVVGSGGEGV